MRIAGITDAISLHLCIFLVFSLFFSDFCSAEIHPFKHIQDRNMLDEQENYVNFISSESTVQIDDTGDVPIVNPTPPGFGMNPTAPGSGMNPTPPGFGTSPTTPGSGMNPTPPGFGMSPTTPGSGMNPTPPGSGMSPTTPGSGMNPPATTTPDVNPITPSGPLPPATTGPVTNPPPNPTTPGSSGGSWCIANPTASETALQVALDYACGYGGTDCSAIQPGATCFEPNTVKDHASYAFNDFYHKNPGPTSCVFGGAAKLTNTDPSHGGCHFASSSGTPTTPPTTTPPMTIPPSAPTPPSMTPPINPLTPGGPTGYGSEPTDFGSEPTGTPSAAKSISFHLSLLFTMTYLMLSLIGGSYI